MRGHRRNGRGLAEIVGTLMLVVIVVAAATAFSFFVASYQKQLQAEEALNHNKSLEDLRILALTPNATAAPPALNSIIIEIASSDVNPTTVDGMTLNGLAVVYYTVVTFSGMPLDRPECLNGDPFAASNVTCVLPVTAESQEFVKLNVSQADKNYSFPAYTKVTLYENSTFVFDLFTSLGNEFSQSFVPPVAIAHLSFVSSVTNSNPILDGSDSYQPSGTSGQNITIDEWSWTVTPNDTPLSNCSGEEDCGSFSGQEYEMADPLAMNTTYDIYLNVTNSDSLVGSTLVQYVTK